jgi:hypothetical protein
LPALIELELLNMNTFAKATGAALALCFATAATPVAAESLPARAVTALGLAIATQGDLALIQIREELQRNLLKSLKPLLPAPAPAERAPAAKPDHE